MFNLEVESEHEYFVSALQVLTHNTDPRCGGGQKPNLNNNSAESDFGLYEIEGIAALLVGRSGASGTRGTA